MNQVPFFGRGPMMIAHDANYRALALAIGVNTWANPDLVSTDSVVSWQSALWFRMEVSGHALVQDSGHRLITGGHGFGLTLNIAHPYECQEGEENGRRHIKQYTKYCESLGVDPGNNVTCPEGNE